MEAQKNKSGLIFEPYRLTAASIMDVPFRIKGHKLRWVSAAVESVRTHRTWRKLRREDIPAEMLKKLQLEHSALFRHDGDTIRYGENVLAYMSLEDFDRQKQEKEANANSQLSQVMAPKNRSVKVDKSETQFESKVSKEFFE